MGDHELVLCYLKRRNIGLGGRYQVMNIKEYFRTLSRKNHFAGAIYKTLSEQRKKRRNQKIIRMAEKAQTHYLEVEKRIRNRGDVPIRFGAYVVFDSTYGADGLFRLMLESPQKWQPKVVIIPDVYRGEKHQKETYKKTKEAFIKKYGAEYIVDGYDMETGRIIDLTWYIVLILMIQWFQKNTLYNTFQPEIY